MKFPRHIPFVELLGCELLKFEGGQAEIALDARDELYNSRGMAHGGVTMTLLDVAMAHAARSPAPGAGDADDDLGVLTIEMKASFMRPATGRLLARGQLVHSTATLAFCTASVFDERGALVAQATGTFKYLRGLPTGKPSGVAVSD